MGLPAARVGKSYAVEPRAATEGAEFDLIYIVGNVDVLESSAFLERIFADGIEGTREGDKLEVLRAKEGFGIDALDTVGNLEGILGFTNRVLNEGFAIRGVEVAADGLIIPVSAIYLKLFESLTFKEGHLVDSVNAVGDVDAREALASLKGAFADGVYTRG